MAPDVFKATHKTFEAYCAERWDFKANYAHKPIAASAVVYNCTQGKLPAPTHESQARELAKLPAKDQPKAWAEAVKTAPDGVVTFRATRSHPARTPSQWPPAGSAPPDALCHAQPTKRLRPSAP